MESKNDIILKDMQNKDGWNMKKYISMLAIQFLFVLMISFFSYFSKPLTAVFGILIYVIVPILSSVSSYMLVTKGIDPYLAWLLPPVAMTISSFLSTMGIGQSPLPIMITALVSLIGSAAGDVKVKMRKKDRK